MFTTILNVPNHYKKETSVCCAGEVRRGRISREGVIYCVVFRRRCDQRTPLFVSVRDSAAATYNTFVGLDQRMLSTN